MSTVQLGAYAEGRQHEREAIVAWLRQEADDLRAQRCGLDRDADELALLASEIETGEHLKHLRTPTGGTE